MVLLRFRLVLTIASLIWISGCGTTPKAPSPSAEEVADKPSGLIDTFEESLTYVSDLLFDQEPPAEEKKPLTPIIIATEGALPPFNATGPDGSVYGLDIEIGSALCLELNFDCTWLIVDADDLVAGLNALQYDLVISAQPIIPSTQAKALISDAYAPFIPGLLARANEPQTIDLNQIHQYTLGVIANSGAAYLLNTHFTQTPLRTFSKRSQALEALRTGAIDAWVEDALVIERFAQSNPLFTFVGTFTLRQKGKSIDGYGVVVRKSNRSYALMNAINQGLASLRDKGVEQRITQAYFNNLPQKAGANKAH